MLTILCGGGLARMVKRKHGVSDEQRIATLSRVNTSRRSLTHVLSLVRDLGLPEHFSRG